MKIAHISITVCLVALCLSLTVWPALAADLGVGVVAKINNKTITVDYLNQKYNEAVKNTQSFNLSKQTILDDLIKRELGIQEARRIGLDKDPEILDRMNTILYQALLEKTLSKEIEKIEITEDDLKNYYRLNPEIRTSHIFLAVPSTASKKEEKEIFSRISEIKNKELVSNKLSFAEVAQKFSEGIAAPLGGDLDYRTKDQLDPDYYQAALKLNKPGVISGIVRTRYGYHIIKLTNIRLWKDVNKNKIKQLVFEERRKQLFDNYLRSLQKNASITTNLSLIQN